MPEASNQRTYRNCGFIRGAFLEAVSDTSWCFMNDALLLYGLAGAERGKIVYFDDVKQAAADFGADASSLPMSEGLHLPPFYDMHFHWVQDDVREMPKASLIEWLSQYTFPEEARYADAAFAREKADKFWRRILRTGTVGGLCYSSIHRVALEEAMDAAQGSFKIGNVTMTMNCPEDLRQDEEAAAGLVAELAKKFTDSYVCSPRFAPTTSPRVMRASAEAAATAGCFQQTHLNETQAEIEWTLGIYRKLPGFEDVESYTGIYDRCGMLGPRTVLGHCIHLQDAEWDLLAATDSVIASCPSSNAPIREMGLGSGLFDWRAADARGVRWTLASDIGGGPFLSMFDVMRSFVEQNEAVGIDATYCRALYRSTRAGLQVLGLEKQKGAFAKGQDFDCIRVAAARALLDTAGPEAILRSIVTQVVERGEYDRLVRDVILVGEKVVQ